MCEDRIPNYHDGKVLQSTVLCIIGYEFCTIYGSWKHVCWMRGSLVGEVSMYDETRDGGREGKSVSFLIVISGRICTHLSHLCRFSFPGQNSQTNGKEGFPFPSISLSLKRKMKEKLLYTVAFSHDSLTLTTQAKNQKSVWLPSDRQSTMQSALLAGEEGWGTR